MIKRQRHRKFLALYIFFQFFPIVLIGTFFLGVHFGSTLNVDNGVYQQQLDQIQEDIQGLYTLLEPTVAPTVEPTVEPTPVETIAPTPEVTPQPTLPDTCEWYQVGETPGPLGLPPCEWSPK